MENTLVKEGIEVAHARGELRIVAFYLQTKKRFGDKLNLS